MGKPDLVARNVFTLRDCAEIHGTQVHSFSNEVALLKAWREFFLEMDPDVLTGYNMLIFDFRFITERALILGIQDYA